MQYKFSNTREYDANVELILEETIIVHARIVKYVWDPTIVHEIYSKINSTVSSYSLAFENLQ